MHETMQKSSRSVINIKRPADRRFSLPKKLGIHSKSRNGFLGLATGLITTMCLGSVSFAVGEGLAERIEVASPSDRLSTSGVETSGTAISLEATSLELDAFANGSPKLVLPNGRESVHVRESTCVQSSVFELSTRHLPKRFCAINPDQPGFEVNEWTGCQWSRSDIDSALGITQDGIDDKITILYVHGNFMERSNTLQRVRIIDSELKRRARADYRLLVLSWPSERAGRPIHDVYDNADSSESQSLYVAWVLNKLKHHSRVSVLGFSFGARAATGGLHLDAGGYIPGLHHVDDGEPNPETGTRYHPYRLGLIAPALDKKWLESCGLHRQALDQVSHFVNMYNTSDPALRRFRFIDRFSRPVAGGYTGFNVLTGSRSTFQLSRDGVEHLLPLKVEQFNCSSAIGGTHDEQMYLKGCGYFSRMADVLLWNVDPIDEIVPAVVSK